MLPPTAAQLATAVCILAVAQKGAGGSRGYPYCPFKEGAKELQGVPQPLASVYIYIYSCLKRLQGPVSHDAIGLC